METEPHPPALLPPAPQRLRFPARIRAFASPVLQRAHALTAAQRIWIGAGAVLALFFVWMLWPRAQEVDVAVIDRGLVTREVVDEGRTRIHDIFLVAAPVGGALQRIELEPGDVVARGEPVAIILPADPALLDARIAAEARASISAAQAALVAAEADSDLARRDRERVARLHAQGFAAQAALDSANAGYRAARSNASARRAELERARIAGGQGGAAAQAPTRVFSPASGRVLRLLQESQSVIAPGAPLMEVGDLGDLEIVAEFLSQDAISIRPGAKAFIENWGGEQAIEARVSRIEPNAHTKVSALGVEEQRVNVIARLVDPTRTPPLGNGFRVDLRVVASEHADAVRAPTDALVRAGADWAVFRLVNGRARLTPVTLGEGGERYRVVRSGLSAGDHVVIFPGDALEDGDRVQPRS